MSQLPIARDTVKQASSFVYTRNFDVSSFHFFYPDGIWIERVDPGQTGFYLLRVDVAAADEDVIQSGVGIEESPGFPSSVYYQGRTFVKGLTYFTKGGSPLVLWSSVINVSDDTNGNISASIEFVSS